MLKDIQENGDIREMKKLEHQKEFDKKWAEFTQAEQHAIDDEIKRILDDLVANPHAQWGSIMNTSIIGGARNPNSGESGDWTGTVWQPIWEHHGQNAEQAGLFFGVLWKLRIILRSEMWIGIRTTGASPTFPNRGVNLSGKTYFLESSSNSGD